MRGVTSQDRRLRLEIQFVVPVPCPMLLGPAGERVSRVCHRLRRMCLRLLERNVWRYAGLVFWLLQRPSLRYVPLPYSNTRSLEEWKEQAQAMVKQGALPRRHYRALYAGQVRGRGPHEGSWVYLRAGWASSWRSCTLRGLPQPTAVQAATSSRAPLQTASRSTAALLDLCRELHRTAHGLFLALATGGRFLCAGAWLMLLSRLARLWAMSGLTFSSSAPSGPHLCTTCVRLPDPRLKRKF